MGGDIPMWAYLLFTMNDTIHLSDGQIYKLIKALPDDFFDNRQKKGTEEGRYS